MSDAEEWIKVQPESERLTFTSDGNSMTSVHRVSLSGLTSGTYVYRVGSEGLWSQEYNFTVKGDDRKTDFFILADIQTEDLADIRKSLEKIRAQNYDFGIQTGDAVDDAASYQDWQSILNLLGTDSLDDTDMLHVLGNHEFSGDASGATSTAIYDLPVEGFGGCYSVVYDDVYIAVINYTANRKQLQDALEWLKTDAANHQESWKLLVMHQPPYYTNPTGGNQEINELVPPVVESLGFDFVFSGHDHSYARTQPMLNGSVNEDGVVYFVCGSTGEKSYSTVNNPDFHFDVVTQDYDSVYLSLSATPNEMTVTAYNIDAAGNVSTLDTYTKSKGLCPDGEHEYIYDRATDRLECSICGEECLAKESRYSGWAIDSVTDRALYFAGGTAVVGDIKLNDGLLHYFDENGLALTGELQICNETCTFDKGAFIKSNNNNVRLAGYVGTNVQWVLYQDGSLKLSGSGDMKDYTNHGGAPWSEYRHDITSIEIGKDITSIGVYAFLVRPTARV